MTPALREKLTGGVELSAGKVAVLRGLRFGYEWQASEYIVSLITGEAAAKYYISTEDFTGFQIPWPVAAERLRYREGEPWSRVYIEDGVPLDFENHSPTVQIFGMAAKNWIKLHRLASILCDTPDAFRLLHECVQAAIEEEL